MRLLLIEDNPRLAEFIGRSLDRAGFAVDPVGSVADAESVLDTIAYDLVILDLGLPDGDGMELLARIRRLHTDLPVLILTARDALEARVAGLNGGADDYLLKPFAVEELVARINALLRRPGRSLGPALSLGNLAYDHAGRDVTVDGRPVTLSRRELDVLELLLRRSGRVVTKAALEDSVYGFNEEVASNSIEVAMHRLRKSLSTAKADVVIHTLRGIGYVIAESAAEK